MYMGLNRKTPTEKCGIKVDEKNMGNCDSKH